MRKPDACRDCPLYDDGEGYVADELCDDAVVLIVAQNPGADEEKLGRPLVGATGVELDEKFLPSTGVDRGGNAVVVEDYGFPTWTTDGGEVSVANVLRCRVRSGKRKTNDLPKGDDLARAVEACRQYDVIQPTIRLIVSIGDLAWSTLSDGFGSVTEWRGRLMKRE